MLTWESQKALPSSEGNKMNYIILKSCFAAGAMRSAGDIVELDPDEAANLRGYNRIAEAPTPKPEPKVENKAAKPKATRAKKDEDKA